MVATGSRAPVSLVPAIMGNPGHLPIMSLPRSRWGQLLSSFTTTRIDDRSASLGRHSFTKTMGSSSALVARLIRSLHFLDQN